MPGDPSPGMWFKGGKGMALDWEQIIRELGEESLFAPRLTVTDCVLSTNTLLVQKAGEGAPEGTALVTECQTGGRGTRGREFHSPSGGLYLSVLLRPQAKAEELLTLTGRAAVAVCRGIRRASGAPAEIKWLNDIWLKGRKLCGILTEIADIRPDGSACVVLGVGVNVSRRAEDFREAGLAEIAVSLAMEGYAVSRESLCAAILKELEAMYRQFPHGREESLAGYRERCVTLGRRVTFETEGGLRQGVAEGVEEDFSLRIRDDAGTLHRVSYGTVALL